MALFIAPLAFSDASLLTAAKRGVLIASAVAGILAMALGRFLLPSTPLGSGAATADEAEASTEH
jgi:NhaA family Na+:H+ antiporter